MTFFREQEDLWLSNRNLVYSPSWSNRHNNILSPSKLYLAWVLRLSLLRQHCYKIFQLAALTSALTKKPEVTGTHTSVSPFEHESSFLFKSTVRVGVTWLVYKFALPCSNFSLLLWRFFLLCENCKHQLLVLNLIATDTDIPWASSSQFIWESLFVQQNLLSD